MTEDLLKQARAFGAEASDPGPWSFSDLRTRRRLYEDEVITVVYAPVDHVNVEARVIVLGLTPGLQQAQIAFETSFEMAAASADDLGREVKRRAAFAGSMRTNLISMLNELSVHEILGIESTAALFLDRPDLIHSTSALRYPVFKNGMNYSGYSPEPTQHHMLSWMLEHVLVPELRAVPNALVVPLGGSVERALEYLVSRGLISESRWLQGFPHPSGANGHRKRLFSANRERLKDTVQRWFAERPPN